MKFSDLLEIVPIDQIKFILIFLLNIFLGSFLDLISNRTTRLIYCALLGFILQLIMYEAQSVHLWVAVTINFLIYKFIKREKVGTVSMLYNFLHNSLIHLYRILFEFEPKVEISLIFMMTTCKFTALAACYSNYSKNEKDTNKDIEKYKIEDFSFLEFVSYIFFFPTSMCGPFIEFKDFIRFIEKKGEYENIPARISLSFKRFGQGILLAAIYTLTNKYGKPELIIDKNNQFSFFEKAFFYVTGGLLTFKYYAAFCLAESSIIASGFGYNGKKIVKENSREIEIDDFDKSRKIEILNIFKLQGFSQFFKHWNISVHVWLKRYLFNFFLPKNPTFAQKEIAGSKTFFVSAFWHGFHFIYFVVFGHFYFFCLLEKQMKKLLIHIFGNDSKLKKPFLILLNILINLVLIPYHCQLWNCMEFSLLLDFFKATYAFVTVGVILLNILAFILVKLLIKKHDKKD